MDLETAARRIGADVCYIRTEPPQHGVITDVRPAVTMVLVCFDGEQTAKACKVEDLELPHGVWDIPTRVHPDDPGRSTCRFLLCLRRHRWHTSCNCGKETTARRLRDVMGWDHLRRSAWGA